MKSLVVINKDNVLIIDPNECLTLEIRLNNSEYGKEWVKLGDILYAWSGTNYNNLCQYHMHNVADEEFNWLKHNLKEIQGSVQKK